MRRAELDALIIVGDDQKELFYEDHLPSILVYYATRSATSRYRPISRVRNGRGWLPRAITKRWSRAIIRLRHPWHCI